MNTRNNIIAVFSVRSLPRHFKKDKEDRLSKLSFETPGYELGVEELN
jgi:hypothetical protein